jgi:hypothetical protein
MATSCNHGEGSSFLSLPTKRNVGFHEPRVPTNNQSQHTIVDFKSKLLPRIIAVCQPPSSGQPPSIAGARETGVVSASQEDLIRKGPLVPSEQQWYTLNQLRIHAGAPERTERGINRLLQYYAQLCWLEERFPFDTHQMANVCVYACVYQLIPTLQNGSLMFTWFEAFSPKKQGIFTVDHNNFSIKHNIVTTSCLQYEKAAVMWNVGAIYSQMAANQSLWTAEGLRLASQYFLVSTKSF